MSKQALLVNPRRRSRKRRTAAQKRATAKMIAANRRRGKSPARRKKTRRRRKSNPVGMYVSNPRRRKRRSTTARRARRRNPSRRGMRGMINSLVMPAATAGAGALALDVLWGYVPVPVDIKTGPMRHFAKGLGAIALGWGVGKIANRRMGDTMAMGALTVIFHTAFRELTARYAPQVALGYYSPGMPMGYDPSLGMYVGPRTRVQQIETPSGPQNEMGMYVSEGAGEAHWR